MPTTLFVMATELVARADGGFACLWALQNCAETIAAFGSEEQKERYLQRVVAGATCSMDLTEPDAGSDLQSAMLSATWSEERGMWLLNGVKRFITNGDADLKLVLARTENGTTDARGLSLFLVDREQGVSVSAASRRSSVSRGRPPASWSSRMPRPNSSACAAWD